MKNKKQNQANKNNSEKEITKNEPLDNTDQNSVNADTESEVVDQTNNKEKLK